MHIRFQLIGCIAAAMLSALPACALSPSQIVRSMQEKSPASMSGHATVVSTGKDIIANVGVSEATSESDLRKFSADLAKRIFADASLPVARLVLVYEGEAIDRIKSVTITRDQWQSIKDKPDPSAELTVELGERATGDFKPAETPAVASANPYENAFAADDEMAMVTPQLSHAPPELAAERAKILDRLETLHKKGVGTHPYLVILQESEDNFKKGNIEAGKECLARLDESLKDQEKQLASRSTVRLRTGVSQSVTLLPGVATTSAAAGVGSSPANSRQPGAPNQKAEAGQSDLIMDLLGNHSITELKGTESQAMETVARVVLTKTLGVDCPNDGPFLVERIRIGTRLHELDQRHVNVRPYREYDRDMVESLIQSKDPRVLRQIADHIAYLERQIGLEQFDKKKR